MVHVTTDIFNCHGQQVSVGHASRQLSEQPYHLLGDVTCAWTCCARVRAPAWWAILLAARDAARKSRSAPGRHPERRASLESPVRAPSRR